MYPDALQHDVELNLKDFPLSGVKNRVMLYISKRKALIKRLKGDMLRKHPIVVNIEISLMNHHALCEQVLKWFLYG